MDAPARRFDRWLFSAGWVAAAAYLALAAFPLHLHEVAEARGLVRGALLAGGLLHLLLIVELLVRRLILRRRLPLDLASALCPPLRMILRERAATGEALVWLPGTGWTRHDSEICDRVARRIEIPMLAIVLLLLPLLGMELAFGHRLAENPALAWTVHAGTAFIWWAFTVEFLVMLGLSTSKFQYCKQHWIELVVILLPLAAGLRMLRLGRIIRFQQLGRMSRAYRLRSALVKVQRAAVLVNLIQRIARRSPEVELEKMRGRVSRAEAGLQLLRAEMQRLEAKCAGLRAERGLEETEERRAWAA